MGSSGILGDRWQFDGTRWTEITSSGPGPRYGAAASVLNGQLVLFGGFRTLGPDARFAPQELGDTWQFDGASWTQVSSSGPAPRDGAVAAVLNGQLVLFGGEEANFETLGDTWRWDGASGPSST